MNARKLNIKTDATIPLIAAFPYAVAVDGLQEGSVNYNPATQLAVFAGGRDYSTCREDESVGIFNSKSDTKKDD